MLQSLKTSDKPAIVPVSPVKLLIITMLDTTWRAFVPTIGGTFLGIGLDHLFNTVPWFTAFMVPTGFLISAILIMLQLKGLKK